jgi:hypothetical protein
VSGPLYIWYSFVGKRFKKKIDFFSDPLTSALPFDEICSGVQLQTECRLGTVDIPEDRRQKITLRAELLQGRGNIQELFPLTLQQAGTFDTSLVQAAPNHHSEFRLLSSVFCSLVPPLCGITSSPALCAISNMAAHPLF